MPTFCSADHNLEFAAEVLGLSQNFIGTLRNQDKNKTQRVPVPSRHSGLGGELDEILFGW